jgi:hypothetical protein
MPSMVDVSGGAGEPRLALRAVAAMSREQIRSPTLAVCPDEI